MPTSTLPSATARAVEYAHWNKIGGRIDPSIELRLDLRQSGHPGRSRCQVLPTAVSRPSGN